MGFRDFFFGEAPSTPSVPVPISEPAFGSYGSPPAQGVGGDLESWNALVAMFSGAEISKSEAERIPAMKRAHDLVCDLGSVLPLQALDAQGERISRALINQPESPYGFTASYSLTNLLSDLWWYGRALWLVNDRDWTTYPTSAIRVPHGRYQLMDDGTVQVDGKRWNTLDCIVFRAKEGGMLRAAAPTVRAIQAMTAIAAQNLNVPAAREFFRSKSDQEYPDEKIDAFLDQANTARRKGRSGWLPPDVVREEVAQVSPKDMLLIDQRNFGVLEVGRLTGTPASWLSTPVVDKTYSNITSERRAYLDQTAMPYLKAVSDRLSLGDCVPSTQRVRWNFGAFLQADLLERYQAHQIALSAGFMTVNEVRELENRKPLPGGDVLPTQAVRNA
jgi:hypothetical protein